MSNHEAIRRLNREPSNVIDKMNLAPMAAVTRAAFAQMDAVQRETEGVQLLSMGALFLMYCRKYGVNPRDVLYKSGAVITDAANRDNEHIGAIARFLKVHLKGESSHLL